jgi:hypothetical protein
MDDGSIVNLRLDWKPLPNIAQQIPNVPGVYFLGSPFRIAYGSTESRVFYIGASNNLRKRLVSHVNAKERGNYLLLRFASATKDNIACCAFPFPALTGDKLLELEGDVIYAFGMKHGFIPHGNRIPESGSSGNSSRRGIEIIEPNSIGMELLNETDIATRYNLRIDRHPYPMYGSLSATIELVGNKIRIARTEEESRKIYSINFMLLPKPVPKR